MVQKRSSATLLGALFVASLAATTAFADHNGKNHGGGGGGKPGGNDGGDPATGVWENWMADDVEAAWNYGGGSYLGQNVTITVVDDFTSRDKIVGVLNGKITRKLHGDWTKHMASATAPAATMNEHDFNLTTGFSLSSGFDVINASYGALYSNDPGSPDYFNGLDAQEQTLVDAAADTSANGAVVAKSAGNAGKVIGSALDADDYGGGYEGWQDQLSLALIGQPGAIFVGALTDHGSGVLADYSNFPGNNTTVQAQTLVVGVDSSAHGIAGTSFAAPIVAGYAAVVSSKFTSATPAQVAGHLLDTATDLGNAYSFGQGEACLLCAISPASIN